MTPLDELAHPHRIFQHRQAALEVKPAAGDQLHPGLPGPRMGACDAGQGVVAGDGHRRQAEPQ